MTARGCGSGGGAGGRSAARGFSGSSADIGQGRAGFGGLARGRAGFDLSLLRLNLRDAQPGVHCTGLTGICLDRLYEATGPRQIPSQTSRSATPKNDSAALNSRPRSRSPRARPDDRISIHGLSARVSGAHRAGHDATCLNWYTGSESSALCTFRRRTVTVSGMLYGVKALTAKKQTKPRAAAWAGKPLTIKQLRKLPTVTLEQAAAVLGIGRTVAYQMARCSTGAAGDWVPSAVFPCRVIRVGTRYCVPTPGLLDLLGDHASS